MVSEECCRSHGFHIFSLRICSSQEEASAASTVQVFAAQEVELGARAFRAAWQNNEVMAQKHRL